MRWLSRDDIFIRSAPGLIEPCLPTPSLRRGVDWTKRFPRIVSAVRKLRADTVLLDGQGVVCEDTLREAVPVVWGLPNVCNAQPKVP